MNWFRLFLIVVLLNCVACQHFEKKSASQSTSKKQKIEKRATSSVTSYPRTKDVGVKPVKLNAAQELSQSRRSDSGPLEQSVELTEKEKIFFELVGERVDNLTEITTYQRVVEKYQKSDDAALTAYMNLLLKKYPRSIYCDNALYLQGMLFFSQKKFGESLAAFQKILTLYPQSNKAVSALFAKGVVFKKMNLNKQALQLLAQVINRYPGSPESARAEVEVKLITQ